MVDAILSVASTAVLAVGVGLLFVATLLRRWYSGAAYSLALGDLGLIGLAVLGVVGSLVHVIVPLAGPTTLILCTAAATGFWLGRRALVQWSAHGPAAWTTALVSVALLFLASATIYRDNVSQYDAGLYHLQTILLNAESPVIPGVANLHIRFGYNSLWHVVLAFLELPLLGLKASLAANGAITVLFGMALVERLEWRAGCRAQAAPRYFALLVLLAVVLWPETAGMGSPGTDWPGSLLAIYAFFLAVLLGSMRGGAQPPAELVVTYAMLSVAAALSVAIKPTHAPVLLLIPLLLPALWAGAHQGLYCGIDRVCPDRRRVAAPRLPSLRMRGIPDCLHMS